MNKDQVNTHVAEEDGKGKTQNAWEVTKDSVSKDEEEGKRRERAQSGCKDDDLEAIEGAGKGTGVTVAPTPPVAKGTGRS